MNYDIVSDPEAEKYQFYYSSPQAIVKAMEEMIADLKAKKRRRKAHKMEQEKEIPVDESAFDAEDL